jgi:hypothetical protein
MKQSKINKKVNTRFGKGIIKDIDDAHSCIIYSILFTTGLFKNTIIDMSENEVYIIESQKINR